ncbi:hypothetical protein [Rhodobaculum claviforme]|uniref:Sulfotransferase family protein n=1 Tax=Rhodobaculum claviforme TaxID=1549854 RepID=A0A934TMM9_9RHOB|nr:hypothetical protein [Rhodobaculum claviforme]MBK5928433.1 hypothetical protein [Rhodobaculum claviforme]
MPTSTAQAATGGRKILFLHIGSHKTATTFLQSSLARNRAALDALGILYPRAGRIHEAHFRLCWELKDPALRDTPLPSLPLWSELLAELDAAPQPVAVLSSEEFGLGLDPTRLEALKAHHDVRVIFYLRSPDSHMESFYNQFVKDFDTREPRTIETYIAEEGLFFLDAMRLLRPWMEMFGADAIRLRLFDRAHLPDGILADFLRTLGLASWPEFRPPAPSVLHKVSLPPDALEYLRISNPWLDRREGHHDFVVRLVEMAKANAEALQETRAGILSLKARQTLRRRFRDSNFEAARTFLGAPRTPFPPLDAPLPPADFDTRPPEACAATMGRVAAMIRNMG